MGVSTQPASAQLSGRQNTAGMGLGACVACVAGLCVPLQADSACLLLMNGSSFTTAQPFCNGEPLFASAGASF
jgi:hypothetical protein